MMFNCFKHKKKQLLMWLNYSKPANFILPMQRERFNVLPMVHNSCCYQTTWLVTVGVTLGETFSGRTRLGHSLVLLTCHSAD